MFHPLVDNAKKLKDNELELKIIELTKKYHQAARFGMGGVCEQIAAILEMYNEEQSLRHKIKFAEASKKDGKNLEDLINLD